MAEKLRWGLLSTARINRALIPAIRASKRSELVAVGSRNTETGQQYAKNWDIPLAHGSYEDLLADPGVDVIYNSLPNHLHAEWTIKAVKAGKHVLAEKPLALSTAEVQAIRSASNATGKTVAEAFMYRHHPQTLKVQELVASGMIGEVRYIQGNFNYILDRLKDIRWVSEYGGGSIWDVGCYPISFIRMITGTVPLSVHGYQVSSETGVDLTFSGHMDFPNGIVAHFYSSFGLPYDTRMEIVGTQGKITVLQPFLIRDAKIPLLLRRENVAEQKITFPDTELYLGEVNDMEASIFDGKEPRLSLYESEENIATITSLVDSARKNMTIRL
jgi:xylose dehydrogenase (NAD/NADP)